MDAPNAKREELLDDYLSEAEIARQLDKDIRTLQRWRKLRIGPPFVMNGVSPIYHGQKARQWLAAGGTTGVSKANALARAQHKRAQRSAEGLRRSPSSI
jgi:hypothetical protein